MYWVAMSVGVKDEMWAVVTAVWKVDSLVDAMDVLKADGNDNIQ